MALCVCFSPLGNTNQTAMRQFESWRGSLPRRITLPPEYVTTQLTNQSRIHA